jgi:hypothetical protein
MFFKTDREKIEAWHKRLEKWLDKHHNLPVCVYNQPLKYILAVGVDVYHQQLFLQYYRFMTDAEVRVGGNRVLQSLRTDTAYFDYDDRRVVKAVPYANDEYSITIRPGHSGIRDASVTAVMQLSMWELFRLKPPMCWHPIQ